MPTLRSPKRVLLVDHDDSFTYNLAHLLASAGATPVARTKRQLNPQLGSQFHGILLGPGHGQPEETAQFLAQILASSGPRPVLGVCLGHQAIAQLFGARVTRSPSPTHGKRVLITHHNGGLMRGVSSPFWAARYNSLTVDPADLPQCLEVIALGSNGEIMALRHKNLPIQGIQFHPESILSEQGIVIIRNWLEEL